MRDSVVGKWPVIQRGGFLPLDALNNRLIGPNNLTCVYVFDERPAGPQLRRRLARIGIFHRRTRRSEIGELDKNFTV